jgi:hypothetical protein
VTGRVYPTLLSSDRVGVYNHGVAGSPPVKVDVGAWALGRANVTRTHVLGL